ncbi:hypothetical protein ASC97_05575 [Rhizobium sp. Root1203]|uniref:hypothetical protein n=1 Tax=Rhizobium sp. Root1203 TaxID=1736427 RepID=UPI00070CC1C8|nr:hypothetical protein [Rhizobium sp. Root1203]KQV27836.1 hypothetical protein ASC97_05575 [Rhizobium sp. Root1203]
MGLIQSKYAKGIIVPPFPAFAGAIVAHRFFHDFAAAPALNDILELAVIPAGARVVDMILDSDDLDSGTALVFDLGIMSGKWQENNGARTVGAEFLSGSTIGQTGTTARPTLKTAFRTVRTGADRSIGLKIATAAGTFAAGQVGLTLLIEG